MNIGCLIGALCVSVGVWHTAHADDLDCDMSLNDVPGAAPRFEQYAVPAAAIPNPAPADIASTPGARMFRTRIRTGAAEGPNFAGHYTIVGWGCGTSCTYWAIVDAISGAVFFAPDARVIAHNHVDGDELSFRRDSRLLITVGAPDEDESREGIAFYVWNDRSLDKLAFISRAAVCAARQ
jgi:hypothetical protein